MVIETVESSEEKDNGKSTRDYPKYIEDFLKELVH
jgi:hypothetical protein